LAIALSLPFIGIGGVIPATADVPMQNASILISDSGYTPTNVTIIQGGTISFTNSGTGIHTATTTGGAPLPFDTGGLSSSQSNSFNLSLIGTYAFTSATDCLNGNSSPSFKCGGGVVNVVAAGAPAPVTVPVSPLAPAPLPPLTPLGLAPQSATVTMSDKGVTPPFATVALGGTVTWVNQGGLVHTATTTGTANPTPFDSGGLGPGQTGSLSFATPGTYTYTSATDCISNSNPGGFGCGPYTITVGSTAAAVPAPVAAAAPAVPVISNTTVTIDDVNGFTPRTLTIRVGQTATWINKGNNVHTASSDPGYFNAWDTGGLGNGQKFSQNFTLAGTYGYHSSTEPVYNTDPNTGNVTVTYMFNGTIVVQ
jgi:plastocyanin